MTSLAIPMPKVKRKRKKPMPSYLKILLFGVIWDVAFICYDTLSAMRGSYSSIFFLGIQSCLFWIIWPKFLVAWRSWKDDD